MGFDALDTSTIEKISHQVQTVQSEYENVSLKINDQQTTRSFNLFVERFPYWSPPFRHQDPYRFKMGARVMNLNS